MGEIKDRLGDLVTYNFSVSKCPARVYEDFIKFCKEETSDNYSMGLKLLMDGMKGNVKEAFLYQKYMEIDERLKKIEAVLVQQPEEAPKRKAVKTMGSKGGENEQI